jgi:hypothetical protein
MTEKQTTQKTKRGKPMDQNKVKVDQYKEEAMYGYADKFINLANELSKSDNSGAVGVALRYAAARYCAFEASLQTSNLAGEKDKNGKPQVCLYYSVLN